MLLAQCLALPRRREGLVERSLCEMDVGDGTAESFVEKNLQDQDSTTPLRVMRAPSRNNEHEQRTTHIAQQARDARTPPLPPPLSPS